MILPNQITEEPSSNYSPFIKFNKSGAQRQSVPPTQDSKELSPDQLTDSNPHFNPTEYQDPSTLPQYSIFRKFPNVFKDQDIGEDRLDKASQSLHQIDESVSYENYESFDALIDGEKGKSKPRQLESPKHLESPKFFRPDSGIPEFLSPNSVGMNSIKPPNFRLHTKTADLLKAKIQGQSSLMQKQKCKPEFQISVLPSQGSRSTMNLRKQNSTHTLTHGVNNEHTSSAPLLDLTPPEYVNGKVLMKKSRSAIKNSKGNSRAALGETRVEEAKNACKICLDDVESEVTGKLITPCLCAGTMQFVHDECLKTWLISKRVDLEKATCELCNRKYNMTFEYKMRFRPKMAVEDGLMSLLTCICLSTMIASLLGVIGYVISTWNTSGGGSGGNSSESDNQTLSDQRSLTFKLAIICACSIVSGILGVLTVVAVREAFFIWEIKKWQILNYAPPTKEEEEKLQKEKEEKEKREREGAARHQSQSQSASDLDLSRSQSASFSDMTPSNSQAQLPRVQVGNRGIAVISRPNAAAFNAMVSRGPQTINLGNYNEDQPRPQASALNDNFVQNNNDFAPNDNKTSVSKNNNYVFGNNSSNDPSGISSSQELVNQKRENMTSSTYHISYNNNVCSYTYNYNENAPSNLNDTQLDQSTLANQDLHLPSDIRSIHETQNTQFIQQTEHSQPLAVNIHEKPRQSFNNFIETRIPPTKTKLQNTLLPPIKSSILSRIKSYFDFTSKEIEPQLPLGSSNEVSETSVHPAKITKYYSVPTLGKDTALRQPPIMPNLAINMNKIPKKYSPGETILAENSATSILKSYKSTSKADTDKTERTTSTFQQNIEFIPYTEVSNPRASRFLMEDIPKEFIDDNNEAGEKIIEIQVNRDKSFKVLKSAKSVSRLDETEAIDKKVSKSLVLKPPDKNQSGRSLTKNSHDPLFQKDTSNKLNHVTSKDKIVVVT